MVAGQDLFLVVAAGQDHRDIWRKLAQGCHCAPSVQVRHRQIGKNEADLILALLEYLHGLNAVLGFKHIIPQAGQHDSGHEAHLLLIINQKHRAARFILRVRNRFLSRQGGFFSRHR